MKKLFVIAIAALALCSCEEDIVRPIHKIKPSVPNHTRVRLDREVLHDSLWRTHLRDTL